MKFSLRAAEDADVAAAEHLAGIGVHFQRRCLINAEGQQPRICREHLLERRLHLVLGEVRGDQHVLEDPETRLLQVTDQ